MSGTHPPGSAVEAELCLLDPAVRRDPVAVAALLDESFVEIGRSGMVWSRGDVMAQLESEQRSCAPTVVEGPVADELAPGVTLVRYRLLAEAGQSRHVSLWTLVDGSWRCRFHQGVVEPRDLDPEPGGHGGTASLTTT